MKKQKTKKRNITLIEVMIVMFLIAMIAGVLAFNYRGTLEKGRAFKTEQGIEKVRTILELAVAERPGALNEMERDPQAWERLVEKSPLAHKPKELIQDGWGNKYEVRINVVDGEQQIEVFSRKFETYKQKNP